MFNLFVMIFKIYPQLFLYNNFFYGRRLKREKKKKRKNNIVNFLLNF